MSDEPPKEQPQLPQEPNQPAPSMWDTLAKNRTEKPRDIAAEVAQEMGVEEDLDTEDLTNLTKKLMNKFDSMVPGDNEEGQVQMDYRNKDEIKSWIFSFDVRRKEEAGIKRIEVVPHSSPEFSYEQRIFHTSRGDFPEMFIYKGMIWNLGVVYRLDENGHAEKRIKFYQLGNPLHEWMEKIPQHEFSGENNDSFLEPLTHQDYAQLKGYITLQNKGNLQVGQST